MNTTIPASPSDGRRGSAPPSMIKKSNYSDLRVKALISFFANRTYF